MYADGPDGGESVRGDAAIASCPAFRWWRSPQPAGAPPQEAAGFAAWISLPLGNGALAEAVDKALRAAAPRPGSGGDSRDFAGPEEASAQALVTGTFAAMT